MNLRKIIALVLILVAISYSFVVAQPELSKEQQQLVRKELVEKIAAQKFKGEFTITKADQIDELQALPRTKSLLARNNLEKGLVIALLRYGAEEPELIFAASLSASLKQRTGVEYAVAFLELSHKVTEIKPATVSKLEEKVEQPKISLEWKENGGTYPVTLTLQDGNLELKCSVAYG